jgi:hypothetical protein
LEANYEWFKFYIVVKVFEYIHGTMISLYNLHNTCTSFDNDMIWLLKTKVSEIFTIAFYIQIYKIQIHKKLLAFSAWVSASKLY